jgi:hypothetical protein
MTVTSTTSAVSVGRRLTSTALCGDGGASSASAGRSGRKTVMNEKGARHEERARHTSELVELIRALVAEREGATDPTTTGARRLLEEIGQSCDGRHFPPLRSALRGLISLGGDSPAIERARAHARTHCAGCGVEIPDRRGACRSCHAAWSRTLRGAA